MYDKFAAEVSRRVKALQQGASGLGPNAPRCDFGAITMPAQIANYRALIDDAVAKGAKILAGGEVYTDKAGGRTGKAGCYFAPTILADVNHSMRCANEEGFGPMMNLIRFKTEAELVALANCTEYGLGSSVFTTDYAKAERITSQLVTGMTSVNDFGMVPMVQSLPFGGVKSSGFGAFNGPEGLRGFSRAHAVVTDRFPMRSQTPKFLQYPVSPAAVGIVQAGVKMVYGASWTESVTNCISLVKQILKA